MKEKNLIRKGSGTDVFTPLKGLGPQNHSVRVAEWELQSGLEVWAERGVG